MKNTIIIALTICLFPLFNSCTTSQANDAQSGNEQIAIMYCSNKGCSLYAVGQEPEALTSSNDINNALVALNKATQRGWKLHTVHSETNDYGSSIDVYYFTK